MMMFFVYDEENEDTQEIITHVVAVEMITIHEGHYTCPHGLREQVMYDCDCFQYTFCGIELDEDADVIEMNGHKITCDECKTKFNGPDVLFKEIESYLISHRIDKVAV